MINRTISHYRVVEQIGAGGMGVVYRARDEQLERDVALKVLPAGMLADEAARKRFRKEALALAKLNHPNIASVHEFGTQDGTDFLVTEYIPGLTLDAKLALGPLPAREVLGFGMQLAEGLAAAHEQGVVHRDLKPANLRITPDGRLKILDFGIAQFIHQSSGLGMTETASRVQQELSGTLPYMAPEQLRGLPADVRSDTWAVGAVLHEMATGTRAFPESSGPMLINSILNTDPPLASKLNRNVSPGLESVIVKGLAKDPGLRYQTARELRADLERLTAGVRPVALERRNKLGLLLICALAILLVVGGTAGYLLWPRKQTVPIATTKARRSVAVLGFKNLAEKPDQSWLSTALSEMLTAELGAGEKLRTIPGENVSRLKAELSLPETDTLGRDTLSQINKALGSDLVVLGSYLDLGGNIRVDLQVQDAVAGESIGTVSAEGSEAKLFDLVKRLGESLRQKCGAGQISAEAEAVANAAKPANTEAERLYAEGLTRLRLFDALAARDLLEQAVRADPHYALAHSALAAAWSQLGYDAKAAEEAKKAFELSKGLARKDVLSIEARYREETRDWPRAVELYRSLWTVFPDDSEYGLRFADAQVSAGNGKDALVTVAELRKLPAPLRDDPRIDLAEANAAASLSDYKQAQAATGQAIRKAQQQGATLLEAEGLLQQCSALRSTGELEQAVSAGQQAKDTLGNANDLRGRAKSLTCVANVLADKGDLSEAKELYEQALALARKIGAQKDIAGSLINLGNVLASQQNLGESTLQYRQALEVALLIGDKPDVLLVQNDLGVNLMLQGDFAGARQMLHASLATANETGDQAGVVDGLINLGNISLAQGDLAESQKDLTAAFSGSQKLGLKREESYALAGKGDLLLAQDDLAGAEKNYQDSLAINTQLGQKGGIASSRVSLATLLLAKGQPEAAETLARQAADEFNAEKDADQENGARDVIAQSLMQQGKFAEAGAEINLAERLSARDQLATLSLAITRASLLGRTGETAKSLAQFGETVQRAKQMGLVYCELRARLAQAEVRYLAGESAAASSDLERLKEESARLGFRLIARKSAETQKRGSRKG
ncbi:MAG: protein kinase [Terriglobales bacterium]